MSKNVKCLTLNYSAIKGKNLIIIFIILSLLLLPWVWKSYYTPLPIYPYVRRMSLDHKAQA